MLSGTLEEDSAVTRGVDHELPGTAVRSQFLRNRNRATLLSEKHVWSSHHRRKLTARGHEISNGLLSKFLTSMG